MAQPTDIWFSIQSECPDCEEVFEADDCYIKGQWIIVTCPHCDQELYDENPFSK